MANHKSSLKRIKQTEKKRLRNVSLKSAIRTAVKNTREAIQSGDKEKATQNFRIAEQALAQGASKGVHHKNNTSRRISRLAKQVAALQ